MTISLCSPQDGKPLAYEKLNDEWRQWYETAHRFERKVPSQDRGDIRHNIIVELATARAKQSDKPFNNAIAYRIASYVVADYWRKQYKLTNGLDCGSCNQKQRAQCKKDYLYSECPKAIKLESLSEPISDNDGNITELGEIIADNRALDLAAWLDAKTFLLHCPHRLIQIALKKRNGDNLTATDSQYLWRFRKREQNKLLAM